MYQEVQDKFMVNYFDVARMTLNDINYEPKDNLNNIATNIRSTHTIRQTPTRPGDVDSVRSDVNLKANT